MNSHSYVESAQTSTIKVQETTTLTAEQRNFWAELDAMLEWVRKHAAKSID